MKEKEQQRMIRRRDQKMLKKEEIAKRKNINQKIIKHRKLAQKILNQEKVRKKILKMIKSYINHIIFQSAKQNMPQRMILKL